MTETVGSTGNGQSWSFQMKLAVPGIYDADKQLNDEQIIALKTRLKDSSEIIRKVTAHIVNGLVTEAEFLEGDDPWFDNQEEFDDYKFRTLRGWNRLADMLIELPGAEWPKGVTPPATFAEALKELDSQVQQGESNG